MMLLWATAGAPLGVYNIVNELNVALRIQPQILTTLSLVTWAECLYYGKVRIFFVTVYIFRVAHVALEILDQQMHCGCFPYPFGLGRD